MKRPIPIPDKKKLQEKLYKAYKPLVDAGIPEKEIQKLLTNPKFWASNYKHQCEMLNALYQKYVMKESEKNEQEKKEESPSGM